MFRNREMDPKTDNSFSRDDGYSTFSSGFPEKRKVNVDDSAVDSTSLSTMSWIPEEKSNARKYMVIVILFIINLLNYMDRYTIAGVLPDVQKFYSINDAMAGLLQTVFIVFFMVFSPLCGFLGDRYNRKWIMIIGIFVWVIAVFASTFIPSNLFIVFMILRGIVGVGEASYAVISPSMIADIFTGTQRSRMLMFFYFAIPMGSGLGYMAGSNLASAFGSWEWGIRLTPILGIVCLVLITVFVYEPERGVNETANVVQKKEETEKASYWDDVKALAMTPTYMFSTFGYTAIVFVTGTLSWWAPAAMMHSMAANGGYNRTDDMPSSDKDGIAFKFGVVTMVAGFVGVTAGTVLSDCLRNGKLCFACCKTPRSDPIICAVGAVIAVPALFASLEFINTDFTLCYILMFTCITGLCFNWAINVDMLMTVVIPSRRNAANSWQILISHLLGDASGPYIIGEISDWIRGSDDSPKAHYESLVKAFYIPNVICIISVVLFAVASMTLLRDQAKFRKEMGLDESTACSPSSTTSSVDPSRESPSMQGLAKGHDNSTYED